MSLNYNGKLLPISCIVYLSEQGIREECTFTDYATLKERHKWLKTLKNIKEIKVLGIKS